MTVRSPPRPTVRPLAPQTNQRKTTQSTGIATEMQLEAVSAGNRIATRRLVKQRQLKSQYKRKRRVEIVCVSMLSKTEKRQRKRESRLRASEAQRDKGRQRSRARDKKKMEKFFFGRTTSKFCSGGDKMRNASGHQ